MDFISDLDFPHPCLCSPHVHYNHEIMDISPFEGFPDHDLAQLLPYSSTNHLCFNEFQNLENSFNLDSEEQKQPFNIVASNNGDHCNGEKGFEDSLLVIQNGFASSVKKEHVQNNVDERPLPLPLPPASFSSKKRSSALEFEEIKKHFDVPLNEAAKQMNVGSTMLKRRCRELNIMRWPHRKIKSLQLLIDRVKELGLTDEIPVLEKHKKMLEKLPGLELCQEAKKLRQACFKAKFKRRRCMALQA